MEPSSHSSKKSESSASNATLNKLRAAVLGANDGIVSTSSVVMGVAGATTNKATIFTAGIAALVAGALSMAVGEYVSVSSQRDAEKAYIDKEKRALAQDPDKEFDGLKRAYIARGVSEETADMIAQELSTGDVLKAHLEVEFGLDEDDISSPTQAAVASFIAFSIGGVIPFLTIIFTPQKIDIWATVIAVLVALCVTGYLSARVGGASANRAIARVVIGGLFAMAITYFVGKLFGTVVL